LAAAWSRCVEALRQERRARASHAACDARRRNMKSRGGTGRIRIDMNHTTLQLSVQTGRGAQEVSDLKAISGGERSFVTAAFITALAKIVAAPFYCLDEVRPRPGLAWAGCVFMSPRVGPTT